MRGFGRMRNLRSPQKNQDWEKERNELQKIIMLLKTMNKSAVEKTYAELIAIKPGFHEIYLHDDYFHGSSLPKNQSTRDFISELTVKKLELKSQTRLVPMNKRHDSIPNPEGSDLEIFGVVTTSIHSLRKS
jgi:hypothetical protein